MARTSLTALPSFVVHGAGSSCTTPESYPNIQEETHGHTNCLPFELERYVCEIAVSSFPECTARVIRVARRFHRWFEPELYRILRSGEDNIIIPPFLYLKGVPTSTSLGLNTERLARYSPLVRHVLLQNQPSAEIARILEACPNVTNLALWAVQGGCTNEILPVLLGLGSGSGWGEPAARAPLRRLSFDPSNFFLDYSPTEPIPFASPIPFPNALVSNPISTPPSTLPSPFLSLTHLEIVNAIPIWSKWSELAVLPHLTHLALTFVSVSGASSPSLVSELQARVLEGCVRLEVFVMFDLDWGFVGVCEGSAGNAWRNDCRVVLLDSTRDLLNHWELGARGGRDFWVVAEEMRDARTARRRLG